jgi:hypothetical protein
MPARDVTLIENGILKNLLTSRTPVKGVEPQSNGHGRGGAAVPSVVKVISTNKKTHEQLKQQLIDAAKEEGLEFGYIVKGVTPVTETQSSESDPLERALLPQQGPPESSQFRLTKPYSIFRVFPDGREEMVRGIEFGIINISALKNVLATSDDEIVYEYPLSNSSLLSGTSGILSRLGTAAGLGQSGYATIITPALLIGGIDLRKSVGNYPKIPIVTYPTK